MGATVGREMGAWAQQGQEYRQSAKGVDMQEGEEIEKILVEHPLEPNFFGSLVIRVGVKF